MALSDGEVVIPGTGHVYFAPVGTPKPASLTAPGGPWDEIGHTSSENGMTITRDGGDSEVLASWQNPNLRERRDPVVFALTLNLLQISNETLSLYFGGGDTSVDGVFGVNAVPVAQERALFMRIVDGANEWPLYIPKVSLSSEDDIEVDTEAFLEFPVRATVLALTGSNLMEWYGAGLGLRTSEVQTVTINGGPTGGTFTLTYAGQTTAGIAYNAAASAVQSALAALSNVGTGNVTVSGSAGGPYTVTFGGALADQNVPQMTANASSLTGGTSPSVTVATTTEGGS